MTPEKDLDALMELWVDLSGVYNKPTPSVGSVAIVLGVLRDYRLEEVRAGVVAHLADTEKGKYYPVPADILARIRTASPLQSEYEREYSALALPPRREDAEEQRQRNETEFQSAREMVQRALRDMPNGEPATQRRKEAFSAPLPKPMTAEQIAERKSELRRQADAFEGKETL